MNRIAASSLRKAALGLGLLVAVAGPSFAGGPLANCQSGQPFLWPGGGVNIPFNPDQGDLGPLGHAAAVTAVEDAFGAWTAIPSSTASYQNAGELPVDVDISNFGPYLNPVAPDGLSAIVFDHTGEIFDLLFGPGSGILGFAGPEFVNPTTCEITEGVSFLNGPSFDDLTAAKDVMVHEFGHYTNLAHTVVNGQNLLNGDPTGVPPADFGAAPLTSIETMYPFYFGPGSGTQTPQADDIAILSALYPEPGYFAATGSIKGTILASNGASKLTGVNVIARNIADPILDAVSAISSDFTDDLSPADPVVGTYSIHGLTPGAQYALYVDGIVAGGFSTPPAVLPGPEEYWNGAAESNGLSSPDDPSQFTPIAVAAGAPVVGIDVIFNAFRPGDPLPVGDDGFVQLFMPFAVKLCGQEFDSVFVNANGSLTFGAGSADFSPSVPEMLAGPPRIAGLWTDLNASAGGTVTFDESPGAFTVRFTDVPEFPADGANSFAITLKRVTNQASTEYGALSALGGLAGLSCGGAVTSGFEEERDLRSAGATHKTYDMSRDTAVFENFTTGDNDLPGFTLKFVDFKRGFADVFEGNSSLARATRIHLPFDTASLHRFSALDPVGGDVDFFRFRVRSGDILAVELVRGTFDSVLGVFDADTGDLLVADDDGGDGLLSRLLLQTGADLNVAVAVSAYPDLAFTGAGGGGGRYVLSVRSYRGTVLPAGDDTSDEVPIAFPFSYQGAHRTSVFVNSNGNLTFETGDGDFSESVAEFLSGPARIAPLWDDLDASTGLVIAEPTPFALNLHYVSVPQFFTSSANYFTVRLIFGGGMIVD
ncbi:MAG TPA: hypothetical protein VI669_03010, partial [Vicinamibacteria bacterium]